MSIGNNDLSWKRDDFCNFCCQWLRLDSVRPNPTFQVTTETETEYLKITETEPKPNPELKIFNQKPVSQILHVISRKKVYNEKFRKEKLIWTYFI